MDYSFIDALLLKLALKHRENKNQRQRIIAFVGSPIPDGEENLVKLGRKLKKNNVAVDVINFGEVEENESKLQAFISSVDSGDNRCLSKTLLQNVLSNLALLQSLAQHSCWAAIAVRHHPLFDSSQRGNGWRSRRLGSERCQPRGGRIRI